MKRYEVTREFIGGALKGLRHTEITNVKFYVGQMVSSPTCGTSAYRITEVREVSDDDVDTREWVKDLVREIDELGLAPYGCWPWDCVLADPSDVVECKQ